MDRMRRRKLLTVVGASVSVALSGCSDADDDTDGDPSADRSADGTEPQSDDAADDIEPAAPEITALGIDPVVPQQGEEFTIEVTIANRGGESLTDTATLFVGEDTLVETTLSLDAGDRTTLSATTEQIRTESVSVGATVQLDGTQVASQEELVEVQPTHEAFVGVEGTDLVVDGAPVYYGGGHSGGNLHSVVSSSDPDGFEYTYEDAFEGEHYVADFMRFASSYGLNVIRIVASPSNHAPNSRIHTGPGEFNETWFKHLDTVVAEAKRNDIRLIVSLMGHDDELAPAPAAYASWSETVDVNADEDAHGHALNDAFFDDEQANDYYKEFIEKLLTRENTITGDEYRNDPTVMMWECGNEIEYWQWENRGESLAEWYDDIASYIKSLDDNHLVGSGMYGGERNAFVEDHQSDAIDVCSFHLYPKFPNQGDIAEGEPFDEEPWADMSVEETVEHIKRKVEKSHNEIGKPVILGEFNVPEYPDVYGWDLEMRQEYFDAVLSTAAEVDLNGVNGFALELNKKYTGEVKITDGRDYAALYPGDKTLSLLESYAIEAAEKSDGDLST